jgi:hypothetical protein
MTETDQTPDGDWKVVRILRVPADTAVHPSAFAAKTSKDEYEYGDPNAEFAIAHETMKLDSRWAAFSINELDEITIALKQRAELLARTRVGASADIKADIDRRGELVIALRNEIVGRSADDDAPR